MGAGSDSCGRAWRCSFTLGAFFASLDGSLDAPGLRLGSDWAPWLRIGILGVIFGASRLHFGWAWELLGRFWRALGVILDAAGDKADIAEAN